MCERYGCTQSVRVRVCDGLSIALRLESVRVSKTHRLRAKTDGGGLGAIGAIREELVAQVLNLRLEEYNGDILAAERVCLLSSSCSCS